MAFSDRLCPFLDSSFVADVVFWPLIVVFLVVALEDEMTTVKTSVRHTSGKYDGKIGL